MGQDSHMKKKVMVMVEIEMEGELLDRKLMTRVISRISKWFRWKYMGETTDTYIVSRVSFSDNFFEIE
jgi:hypothetical protein